MAGYYIVGLIIFLFVLGTFSLLMDTMLNKNTDIIPPPKEQPKKYIQYDDVIIYYDDDKN